MNAEALLTELEGGFLIKYLLIVTPLTKKCVKNKAIGERRHQKPSFLQLLLIIIKYNAIYYRNNEHLDSFLLCLHIIFCFHLDS